MMAAARSPIRVVGRYALYNEIAAGGMATIHLGRLLGPVGFARTVAVKRLHPQYAKDPEFVSMFLDEARLAARVQHPNVVATIDVVATDGELFLIMDYVRGESLSKLLRMVRKKNAHVPPRIAAAIMCGFLHGLHSAHEAKDERGSPLNLVHRDVSPQNVLVGADGIPRVLDFGIAKAAGRIQVTRDGQIKGKLAYMPPEQLAGRELSRAVDIYASAVVMWETLTAERLFKAETEAETLTRILRAPVPSPSEVYAGVPREFNAPVLKSLSRDPTKRHATAKELALELERCVGIASPTEVGEWVEDLVGPSLNAREEAIAQIELSSQSITVSQSIPPPESSDSDFARSSRAIVAAAGGAIDTIPYGSEHAPGHVPPKRATPEDTGTRTRSNLFTSTMQLPLSRKLPIFASLAGLLVLIVVVVFVVAGKAGDAPKPIASNAPAASGGDPAPSSAPASPDRAIPDPPASAAANDEPLELGDDDAKPEPEPEKPRPTAPRAPIVHPRPQPAPAPKASATPVKKGCEQNFTIDPTTGRKTYKLECM
ncbi:MAG: serine/threonine protein kinase [Labilithrix sp.]|nr:serine/threonine protein kinase [Labilithrix sp.]MCW5811330.1 serine/threonine protein kinase [Labilithrix sp.]